MITNLVGQLETGGLAQPATLLVEKVFWVIGGVASPVVGIARPYQMKRLARAEGDSEIIRAEAEAKTSVIRAEGEAQSRRILAGLAPDDDYNRGQSARIAESVEARTSGRILMEETQAQANMEQIISNAIELLGEGARPGRMDDDWITNFCQKCRAYSDEEMQEVWAHILAGEANNVGSFSRKTVSVLADMDKRDAERFGLLCRFVWRFPSDTEPVIYPREAFWREHGLTFELLTDLEALGLIRTEVQGPGEFGTNVVPQSCVATYSGRRVEIVLSSSDGGYVPTGNVVFTSPGRQISSIIEPEPIGGFCELMCQRWSERPEVAEVSLIE